MHGLATSCLCVDLVFETMLLLCLCLGSSRALQCGFPGELGIPVLKHLHHVWPHYVTDPQTGERRLYILVHGWSAGKFAVLRHEPEGAPSHVKRWNPVTDRQE